MRDGKGMLRLANNNRYEGEWKCEKKNGNGRYFFLNKGQMLEGYWVDDINKTGKMIDFDRESASDRTQYILPPNHLKDSAKVLQDSIEHFKTYFD
jgi:hypothetical protein